ncbi:antitoxin VbhA family protein [Actinoplanes solisilvae]|uniref:antitoxin VbhA family protein n=1 Tax=Actinoplanes solisilvae TaxID=2486853 RepID=UPI000FD717E3|nr:antitoxin VbhA family protein [Actinoplanes solisilvae]
MPRQDVLGVAEARKQLPDLLAGFSRGSGDSVFLGAHRKAVGVLVPVRVYDELRSERDQAVDDATGSLRAEGQEPSSVASELAGLFAQGRITAGQMEAMLLAYHRA